MMSSVYFLLLIVLLTLLFACSAQAEPFTWGTATAAYQIEGAINDDGRSPSIWDTFCENTNKVANNESGAIADDDYHRWLEDLDLMAALNLTNYRFSIAWPRILPDGFTINQAGLDHYRKILNALIERNIRPLVTLYHWDLPQSVYNATNGGWINPDIISYFVRYADTVFTEFQGLVKQWVTFNEPWTFCVRGYDGGGHAPGRCSNREYCAEGNSSTEAYQCAHNVLLSHAAAFKLFSEKGYDKAGGKVGMTININWAAPASESKEDIAAAQRNLLWQGGWYADPLWFGDYPQVMKDNIGERLPRFTEQQQQDLKGSHHFFALNHYTTRWVMNAPYNGSNPEWYSDQDTWASPYNQYNGSIIGVQGESNWLYVVPWGLYKMLHWVADRYDNPPLFITENGVDVPGENNMSLSEVLNDTFRINFYQSYIGSALKAKEEGVDLRSYIAWSLMDNFEWTDGYSKRFGLHFVNYTDNQTRYQKASAKWYAQYARDNPTGDYQVHLKLAQKD
eukprot:465876_1